MSRCYCACVLAVLVIVFAWVDAFWARIALTILGAILAVKALAGVCCCVSLKEKRSSEATEAS
jgi:hypothetical protein